MNDSFLEDLDLAPKNGKRRSHITTRNATSSPLQRLADTDDIGKSLQQKQDFLQTEKKDSNTTKMTKRESNQDVHKQITKTQPLERKEKTTDSKLKPVENKIKPEYKEKEKKIDNKVIAQDIKTKTVENKVSVRERGRRSGSYKENNHSSDGFTKESSRQIETSEHNNFSLDSRNTQRRSEIKENDQVPLLNAIEDLISTYTKEESTKVLKAMQDVHINSQAALIKTTLFQTEELIKEMQSRDSMRMKILIGENEKLREDNIILKKKNENLQKKLEELQLIKQENISLKLKYKELSK